MEVHLRPKPIFSHLAAPSDPIHDLGQVPALAGVIGSVFARFDKVAQYWLCCYRGSGTIILTVLAVPDHRLVFRCALGDTVETQTKASCCVAVPGRSVNGDLLPTDHTEP